MRVVLSIFALWTLQWTSSIVAGSDLAPATSSELANSVGGQAGCADCVSFARARTAVQVASAPTLMDVSSILHLKRHVRNTRSPVLP